MFSSVEPLAERFSRVRDRSRRTEIPLKILELRGGALGDLILTLPSLRVIRESYPGAEIELLGIFPQARLAVPEYVDRADRIDAIELAPLFLQGDLPESLRARLNRFDVAFNFFADPNSVLSSNLKAAGIPKVFGGLKEMSSESHAVRYLAGVLEALGLPLRDPVPSLTLGPRPFGPSRFAFHPGSGSIRKNWPVVRWVELIHACDNLFDDFLLIGGEADEAVIPDFLARCQCRRLKTILGADLVELGQELNACTVFAGHDTGVTHLAAAVGTPTIALFGPTNPNVWSPLGKHVRVIQSPTTAMDAIELEEVVAAVVAVGQAFRP